MTTIFARARFLLTLKDNPSGKLERINDGYILTQGPTILKVGQYSETIGQEIINEFGHDLTILGNSAKRKPEIEDLKKINGVILPGFVKCHGHDHESCLIGVARDQPLTAWLDNSVNIFTGFLHENESELKKELEGVSPYFVAYLKARLDDVSYGITSAVTHHCNFNKYHVEELVDANETMGTRIFIAVGSQDRNYDPRILDTPEEAIERLDKYEKFESERSIIIPGPDQFFSNGPELLKSLKKWAKERQKLIHIHSSEEPDTTKWFTEKYGMTPTQYGNSIGFLDEFTLLAHQVNNTEQDLNILQETKAMVVHNPLANTILGSGMPPILEMIKRNIPVAISTDGSGSADNQNMLNAARLASQYQKALNQDAKVLDSEEVLKRVTRIPAQMLRLNCGVLEQSKDADFIIIDLSVPNMTPTRLETVIENLIWASSGNEIHSVIANGKILVENYEFRQVDKNQILNDIQILAEKFEDYKNKSKARKSTGAHGKAGQL
jgi:5-methylthioadenosine/S-adenosylhomocysteine deaminase